MSFVSELEPRPLWKHFDEILKIPRRSKDEGRIREYVIGVAKRLGLEHRTDRAGNVVVRKPATRGHEKAPVTVLQSHLDMVQEKNSDVKFDFEKGAIVPLRDGAYLRADGTTLGSDNGVGVAAMLALMEAGELSHGPLELLFTVDEETGLTGAKELADDLLAGRQLINVDSEEEGVVTIGCAGGADSKLQLPLARSAVPAGAGALEVRIGGLKGGHSGIDIHLQRGNATKLLVRALHAAALERPLRIAELRGGKAHNAIPREASAVVVVAGADLVGVRNAVQREFDLSRTEYHAAEPGMELTVREVPPPGEAWDQDATAKALALLVALPHGVMSMSYDIPGLVETSTNLAVAGEKDGALHVWMSSRSSVASALTALRRRLRAIAALAGASVEEGVGYPGWKPDVSSRLLGIVRQAHQEVTGKAPRVGAVHAGLECGIIGEKYRGMDMISIGPQIEFPHSPDERVEIDSVGTFWKVLTATLDHLA
jgi:dipeptidase D